MAHRILCISNGHGEDTHTAAVIGAMREREPGLQCSAIPIVGEGLAYRRIGVPVIGPTLNLPSGGFAYMHPWMWLDDVRAGLVGLAARKVRAVRQAATGADAVFATGDHVGQAYAWLSGRPFVSFISPLSALYEGQLRLNIVLRHILASKRCRAVFTRDRATAADLERQGVGKVRFGGIPSLDTLIPAGIDLAIPGGVPVLGLLPGSRLPEAERNLRCLLDLTARIARRFSPSPVAAVAGLVRPLFDRLATAVAGTGWAVEGSSLVRRAGGSGACDAPIRVSCRTDAFADVLHASTLILGMAGLAVDEAVALGKPVLLVPGAGPQHTWAFAESQSRLLGPSARLIGRGGAATPDDLEQAAQWAIETLRDEDFLARASASGRDRLGSTGAADRIAEAVLDTAGSAGG